MPSEKNELGQPIGAAVSAWKPPSYPPHTFMVGQYCRVEPLNVNQHAAELYAAYALDRGNRLWTYLPYGPFDTLESYVAWMHCACCAADSLFFAIIDAASRQAVGVASYLRIDTANGCAEIGHINFSPRLQRTTAATEAMYLMLQRLFELGYRRVEWKCDALNAPSRAAAQRLGFTYEGLFRQACIYKGRNRDTAWYAMIDQEWPLLQRAFLRWLHPDNFHADGTQRTRLADLRLQQTEESQEGT